MSLKQHVCVRLVTLFFIISISAGATLRAIAQDTYFITQAKIEPGSTVHQRGLFDQIIKTNAQGKKLQIVVDLRATGQTRIRTVSMSTDASMMLYCLGPLVHAQPSYQLLLLSDGKVKTIDLTSLGLKVFGAPTLLPDKAHIGLTIFKKGPLDTPENNRVPKRTNYPRENGLVSIIATMDLDGNNLKEIGPGTMPCWSPDGKTILYTEIKMEDSGTGTAIEMSPKSLRLCIMDADGRNAHPIAPDRSCDGSFSPDGQHISYVIGNTTTKYDGPGTPPKQTNIVIADSDGSHVRTVTDSHAVYASPRWLEGGGILTFVRKARMEDLGTKGYQAPYIDTVWTIGIDGSNPHRISENGEHALMDEESERLVYLVAAPHITLNRPTVAGDPNFRSIPEGSKLVFQGPKVFFRDSSGHLTPAPDGKYRPFNNEYIMTVRGGERVISN